VRVRLRYSKLGKVRFTSHRDGARLWERAARKAQLPVAFTRGFTPRPKLSFGLALPTGAESIAEYIDITFDNEVDVDELPPRLSGSLPTGFDVVAAQRLHDGAASLQNDVSSVTWELFAPWLTPEHHRGAAARLMAATTLPIERERKGETHHDDVRPVIIDLHADDVRPCLVAELATEGRALRPAELAELAYPHCDPAREPYIAVRAVRTHQWIEHDGERREVISLPAGVSALTEPVSA
jgi:radical SAM-linked protein